MQQQTSPELQANSSNDVHYAELSLSRNNTTISSAKSANKQVTKASTSSATGNYDIYINTKYALTEKPPAYDYFKEPTVYAQIDHFKTMQHKSNSSLQYSSDHTYNTRINNDCSGNESDVNSNACTNGTLSNSNTLTFSSIQLPSSSNVFYNSNNQAQTPQQSLTATTTTTATSKQYSREIVTIRTPLLFSQQESCV